MSRRLGILFFVFVLTVPVTFAVESFPMGQLLRSVRTRSERDYLKLHHPLIPSAKGCPDLLQHKWDFLPVGYQRRQKTAGLPLRALTDEEKGLVDVILRAALSEDALRKVESARRQDEEIHNRPELLLDERFKSEMYGYNKYELAVFGDPEDGPCLITLQGHHLYLTIPVRGNVPIISTPLFFGEYPKVSELQPQEDAARALATLLENGGVDRNHTAIKSMLLRPGNSDGLLANEVIANAIKFSRMNAVEKQALDALIETFLINFPATEKAKLRNQVAVVKKETPERILFRWEGDLTPGFRNHFYVIIGLSDDNHPTVAFEHENVTDAKGEHIHSLIWSADNFGGL
jgi:Protein of unknown function (DUF3500)